MIEQARVSKTDSTDFPSMSQSSSSDFIAIMFVSSCGLRSWDGFTFRFGVRARIGGLALRLNWR